MEMIVDGALVSFSNAGTYLNNLGEDPRAQWAPKIEAGARRICGRSDGILFRCEGEYLSVILHEDAVRPVVRVITEALPDMPQEIHGFYQRICFLLEHGERYTMQDIRAMQPRETSLAD